MGKTLRVHNIPRRKVVLMSKCCRVVCDQENFDPGLGLTMLGSQAGQSKDYVNSFGEPPFLLHPDAFPSQTN